MRTSRGWNPPVRATTGEPLDCSGPEGTPDVCALGGDDHRMVADPLGGTFRTAVHRTDGRGCGTHAGPGIARQVEGRATRAKVDCVTLDHPRDAVVDALGEVWSRGPDIAVLDADGRAICELWPDAPDACRLTVGAGPTGRC